MPFKTDLYKIMEKIIRQLLSPVRNKWDISEQLLHYYCSTCSRLTIKTSSFKVGIVSVDQCGTPLIGAITASSDLNTVCMPIAAVSSLVELARRSSRPCIIARDQPKKAAGTPRDESRRARRSRRGASSTAQYFGWLLRARFNSRALLVMATRVQRMLRPVFD